MKQKPLFLAVAGLLIMAGGALALVQMKSHQRLGSPGVLTRPLPDSNNLEVILPERVLDYSSKFWPMDTNSVEALPPDTSFGSRMYWGADNFLLHGSVVLMGTDRTSLHKPQFCVQGQGWKITAIERITIPIARPAAYEMPAARILLTAQKQLANGQMETVSGVYIYWYVANRAFSGDPDGWDRMWSMAEKLLTTGELQRWAYCAFLANCQPGQEEATYNRMRDFLIAAIPEFQITQPENVVAVRSEQ